MGEVPRLFYDCPASICVAFIDISLLLSLRPPSIGRRNVFHLVTPDSIMAVYRKSVSMGLAPKDMLSGEAVLVLTDKESA